MRRSVSLPGSLKGFDGKMQLSGGEPLKRDSRERKMWCRRMELSLNTALINKKEEGEGDSLQKNEAIK